MGEWISVKDRLPTDKDEFEQTSYCLVFIDDHQITSAWYDYKKHGWISSMYNSDSDVLIGVTCWMPIPEPPKV
jgi:hypothetical protein